MINAFKAILTSQKWPPLGWALLAAGLLLLFTHFGFYHWQINVGLLFAVFWIRPNREFFAWYLINTLCATATAYKNALLRDQTDLPFLGLWPSSQSFLLGAMAMPWLVFIGVQLLKHRDIRTANASSFRGMSHLLSAGLVVALMLTLKDIAYVVIDGKISEVKAGRIIDTQILQWANALEVLGSFTISHFMGAFIGVMIVVPLVMWFLEPGFRAGSRRLLGNALRILLPIAVLIALALNNNHGSQFFGMLQVLLLAAVVVLSFFHGWRGAVVSIVLISVMITIDNHLDPHASDPKEMQLYVSIVGAMALLLGAAMDDLKARESDLERQRLDLYQASMQKQGLLSQLIAASRRSMQAQDHERQRIAHELHDEVGQSITALQIHLKLLDKELQQCGKAALSGHLISVADKISEGVRHVVMDLAPVALSELGLENALSHGAFASIAKQAGLHYQVTFRGQMEALESLEATTRLAAYRIVQESLTNIIRHAHAQQCQVRLSLRRRHGEWLLFLVVQDDGVGLSRSAAAEQGFVSIRDRTLALNGRMHIRSRYGLRVHILLRQPDEARENRRDRRRKTSVPAVPI